MVTRIIDGFTFDTEWIDSMKVYKTTCRELPIRFDGPDEVMGVVCAALEAKATQRPHYGEPVGEGSGPLCPHDSVALMEEWQDPREIMWSMCGACRHEGEPFRGWKELPPEWCRDLKYWTYKEEWQLYPKSKVTEPYVCPMECTGCNSDSCCLDMARDDNGEWPGCKCLCSHDPGWLEGWRTPGGELLNVCSRCIEAGESFPDWHSGGKWTKVAEATGPRNDAAYEVASEEGTYSMGSFTMSLSSVDGKLIDQHGNEWAVNDGTLFQLPVTEPEPEPRRYGMTDGDVADLERNISDLAGAALSAIEATDQAVREQLWGLAPEPEPEPTTKELESRDARCDGVMDASETIHKGIHTLLSKWNKDKGIWPSHDDRVYYDIRLETVRTFHEGIHSLEARWEKEQLEAKKQLNDRNYREKRLASENYAMTDYYAGIVGRVLHDPDDCEVINCYACAEFYGDDDYRGYD